ncbi:MAG TPA: hypothetical protein VGJ32_16535 [Solirubrobacteraceae bacterium]|jgi:hypothetical protein
MAMRARLRVDGLEEAAARLDDVGDRARRPEPALRAPGTLEDLQRSERRKFARGGWRKASPEWVDRKRRAGLDTRTLRATGRLESALTNATHGVRATVFNAELKWGIRAGRSEIYYAQPLAAGASGMPPRRMVVIDKIARGNVAERVERFIADGTLTGGGRA